MKRISTAGLLFQPLEIFRPPFSSLANLFTSQWCVESGSTEIDTFFGGAGKNSPYAPNEKSDKDQHR